MYQQVTLVYKFDRLDQLVYNPTQPLVHPAFFNANVNLYQPATNRRLAEFGPARPDCGFVYEVR